MKGPLSGSIGDLCEYIYMYIYLHMSECHVFAYAWVYTYSYIYIYVCLDFYRVCDLFEPRLRSHTALVLQAHGAADPESATGC